MTDPRIQAQKQRIQQHSGDDSQLRAQLNKLRARRNPAQQRTPTPWSGQYEATVGQLNQQRDLTDTNLTAQEQQVQKQYGFEDTSDPFSRANQLQQGFANANRGTTNNYAAAGQLYAGSLTDAHAIDQQNFDRSYDQARKDQQSALDEIAQRRLQAGVDYQGGVLDAEGQRLQDAVSQRVDPAEAPRKGKGKPNKRKGK